MAYFSILSSSLRIGARADGCSLIDVVIMCCASKLFVECIFSIEIQEVPIVDYYFAKLVY